jgi:hypothetical protein
MGHGSKFSRRALSSTLHSPREADRRSDMSRSAGHSRPTNTSDTAQENCTWSNAPRRGHQDDSSTALALMSEPSSILRRLGPAALLVLWWLALGICYSTIAPSPDQFELQYVGERMLSGAIPYIDIVDMNWPGGFWLHALTAWYVPETFFPWRVEDFVIMLAGLLFGAGILHQHGNAAARTAWLVLYPLLYATAFGQWFSGQRDIVAAHVLIIAAWTHLRAWEHDRIGWNFATGLLVAFAMLLKPTMGVAGLAFVLHVLLSARSWRERFRGAVHMAVAGIIAASGVAAGFLIARLSGAGWVDIWECAFVYNAITQHRDSASTSQFITTWWRATIGSWYWISAIAAVGMIMIPKTPSGRRVHLLLILLWLAGALNYWVQGRAYPYHLGMYFSFLCVFTAIGVGSCWRAAWSSPRAAVAWPARVAILIVLAATVAKLENLLPNVRYALGMEDRESLMSRYTAGGGSTMADAIHVVERIRSTVPPDETVLVWGIESVINHLAARPQPTRFYYGPLLGNARPPLPMADRWNAAFKADLARCKPAACVVSREFHESLLDAGAPAAEHVQAILRDYELVMRAGGLDVYLRTAPPLRETSDR